MAMISIDFIHLYIQKAHALFTGWSVKKACALYAIWPWVMMAKLDASILLASFQFGKFTFADLYDISVCRCNHRVHIINLLFIDFDSTLLNAASCFTL